MTDRPAAELLDTYGPGSDFAKTWGEGMQAFIVGLIERVARAEQALAAAEAYADRWRLPELRAARGGQ